jgi:hypothetical protein
VAQLQVTDISKQETSETVQAPHTKRQSAPKCRGKEKTEVLREEVEKAQNCSTEKAREGKNMHEHARISVTTSLSYRICQAASVLSKLVPL